MTTPIEITETMIAAGADRLMQHPRTVIPSVEAFRNLARDVFVAMTASRSNKSEPAA